MSTKLDYIRLSECKDRRLYKIHSRNLITGVFSEKVNGFIGIREKFDDKYLFTEYHYDTGPPFGTAKPVVELSELPEDIELKEYFGSFDSVTGREVKFDKPISDGGKGWYFVDTGEPSKAIQSCSRSNRKLQEWISKQRY